MVRERVRRRAGRTTQPSAGISARQSRKTTRVGGMRGYDGGKQISGRKRHLLGATRGLVVRAKVHAADLQDRAAVPVLVQGADAEVPTIALVGVDRGYTGTGAQWIGEQLGWQVEVVHHPPRAGRAWQWGADPEDPAMLRVRWAKVARTETGLEGCAATALSRGTVVGPKGYPARSSSASEQSVRAAMRDW